MKAIVRTIQRTFISPNAVNMSSPFIRRRYGLCRPWSTERELSVSKTWSEGFSVIGIKSLIKSFINPRHEPESIFRWKTNEELRREGYL